MAASISPIFSRGPFLSHSHFHPSSSNKPLSSFLPIITQTSPQSKPILRPPSASTRQHVHRRFQEEPKDEDYEEKDGDGERRHRALLVEGFHRGARFRAFLRRLSSCRDGPLGLLAEDGDWPADLLWAAVAFLVDDARPHHAVLVFDCWTNKEITRTNEAHYSRIIRLLCERNLMREAISTFQDMEKFGLVPSLATYNAIIHGFAREKKFEDATATLEKMLEAGLRPKPETYNGLIRAYGSYRMYDDMSKCAKRMESDGCFPDEVTYNILVTEFALGGLLKRMERAYRTILSEHMKLQPSTVVAMLEAYTEWEILGKMEKVYSRISKSKVFMKESLIRKLATVYIKNRMFSRLEDLGNDVSSTTGRTDLVWRILLLASACSLSRRGLQSVIREMEEAKVQFTTTFLNIIAHFYLKIKDFRALDATFIQAGNRNTKLDIVTIGIFFDACEVAYDGTRVLGGWTRRGLLEQAAQMKTDQLVLTAFGKGFFLKSCEKLYSRLDSKAKSKNQWRYCDLINLAFREVQGVKGEVKQFDADSYDAI